VVTGASRPASTVTLSTSETPAGIEEVAAADDAITLALSSATTLAARSVDVVVQAHPLRKEMAEQLAADLGGTVVFDPDPDGYRSPWRTYRACLERPAATSHRLVLQDDVAVCPNLIPAVERIADAMPDHPVALFVSPQSVMGVIEMERSCRQDRPYARWPVGQWIPAVAVLWPLQLVEPLLAYVDRQDWPVQFSADDEILGRATRAIPVDVYATVPSLVEHPDLVDSVVRNGRARQGKNPDRLAWCLIDGDPLKIDWTLTPT
jgi:hypothetical protein